MGLWASGINTTPSIVNASPAAPCGWASLVTALHNEA